MVVEPAAVRTCFVGEACVGAASAAVDSLGLGEKCMIVRQVATSSHPTFAMDTWVSHSISSWLRDAVTPEALQSRRCYSAIAPERGHRPVGDVPQVVLSLAQGG